MVDQVQDFLVTMNRFTSIPHNDSLSQILQVKYFGGRDQIFLAFIMLLFQQCIQYSQIKICINIRQMESEFASKKASSSENYIVHQYLDNSNLKNNRQQSKVKNQSLHKGTNEYQNQRILKISQQLNNLDRLIQYTQMQSIQAANILKHCTNYSDEEQSNSYSDNDNDSPQYAQYVKEQQNKNKILKADKTKQEKSKFEVFDDINLNQLQQQESIDEDTINMKKNSQGKVQAKTSSLKKQKYSSKNEPNKKKQIKRQSLNIVSKSQCQKQKQNSEITENIVSQNYSNQLNFIGNDRILSYSHHYQEQQSSEFHQDLSSAVQISQIKAIDTTIKKTKQQKQRNPHIKLKQKQKSNHSQSKFGQKLFSNKKNNKNIIGTGTAIGLAFQKPRILSNKEKQKIGRIKSENKLINNQSNFGRGINLIKEKMKLQIEERDKAEGNNKFKTKQNSQFKQKQKSKLKVKKFMFASTSKSTTYQKNNNFNSMKGEPLNSKRNIKYNSISKPATSSNLQMLVFHQPNNKPIQKSKNQNLSKFHLNLQKQVTMKISDLKLKKNLCQIQTNYLSASLKITKQEIEKIFQMKEYSDQRLLKHFMIKSLVMFISQYNDQNWQDQGIDLQNSSSNQRIVQKTMKSPQKFIKVINKLPDILRRRNVVSQKKCKQFISQKIFTDQKIVQLGNNGQKGSHHNMQKDILYMYMNQLHIYLQFLLNNNMIHQTKRSHIFNPSADADGFFSDRSVNNTKKQEKNKNRYNQNAYNNQDVFNQDAYNDDANDVSCNKVSYIHGQKQQYQDKQQRMKEYDSERKKQESYQLKRTSTVKNLKKTAKTKLKK